MPTVNLRGLTFDYVDEGDAGAPACLLLHGFPQDRTSWDQISAGLMAAGYRVVRFDQRGYSPGARPGPVRAYRLAEPVSDAVALLDHLGLDTVHVVGHDWGGAVAWGIAAQHPERVQTLTVISTPHPAALARAMFTSAQGLKSWYMGLFQVPGLAERLLTPGSRSWKGLTRGLPASHRDHYAERAREPGALPAMLNWYRAMPSDMRSPSVRWRRITPSTLYVWGADDPALGRTAARLTGDWISGPYTFVELPGEGHWLPERCASKVLAVLLPHLGGA